MKPKTTHQEKHEFAFFIESLSSHLQEKNSGDTIILSDEKLIHRMVNVLRLTIQDRCVLFDQHIKLSAIIDNFIGKKQVRMIIESIQKTTTFRPTIIFLLPLLKKRDDYESALYGLTEVGVTVIQPIFTEKTMHQRADDKDNERAQRILIGAAEQSKNFAYPQIEQPISLDNALKKYNTAAIKIFFDQNGAPLFDVMHTLHNTKVNDIVLLVGPEGDLTVEEKKIVQINNFTFCALTPTTMRTVQAAVLSAGFVRSLLITTSN